MTVRPTAREGEDLRVNKRASHAFVPTWTSEICCSLPLPVSSDARRSLHTASFLAERCAEPPAKLAGLKTRAGSAEQNVGRNSLHRYNKLLAGRLSCPGYFKSHDDTPNTFVVTLQKRGSVRALRRPLLGLDRLRYLVARVRPTPAAPGHSSLETPPSAAKDGAENLPLRLTYACFCSFRALPAFLCT